ncbi:cyanate lyase C-terminal domain-containing protein [Schizophyllum amplum]|uniref:Cyanate hydratase n=1 Tax=Schizophyllum amplum TaxID=97359 RepID=A0A550CJD7_9AGAR|nr:cyanate lyase C-terminal domain-containing protein [Auriculariopsis ampla]
MSSAFSSFSAVSDKLFQAKAQKGLTFDDIAKAIGRDEIWVAAAFYGQAKPDAEELAKLSEVLGLSPLQNDVSAQWWPMRGDLGPMPPTDPVIYRLYEGVMVYGHAIKAIIHEKFGDGIMSMINCKVTVEKKPDPAGDRVVLTFDGKYLPYSKW